MHVWIKSLPNLGLISHEYRYVKGQLPAHTKLPHLESLLPTQGKANSRAARYKAAVDTGKAMASSPQGSSSFLLYFCVVSLKNNGGKRELELSHRFRMGDATVDLAGSEPILKAFAAPLGPESIPPKEYMASEVRKPTEFQVLVAPRNILL